MTIRLAIFVTHPVQYHVPIWRKLTATPGLRVWVYYFSDQSIRGGIDPGFGVPIAWDVPLLEGYEHEFITRDADFTRPHTIRIPRPRQLLKQGGFDWVFIQGYTHGFERQLARLAGSMKYKVLMRGEFTDVPRRSGRLKPLLRDLYLRWFYNHVDAFCYIGKEARLHLDRRGIPAERKFFSPYSVDNRLLELQLQKFKREECRAGLGLKKNYFTFLFSGKIIPRKMPLLLSQAVQRLSSTDNLALILLGDGQQKDAVVSALRPLLGSRLIMPGFVNQSELGKYFVAADAFILPSSYETWGLVVNEAMQFGLPVIVSDKVGCHRDLVLPGATGKIFPSGNADVLSNIMGEFMSSPEKAARLGELGRQHIKAYSVEASVSGIINALSTP